MKNVIGWILISVCAVPLYADILADGSNVFSSDTKTVAISTTCTSPTQIATFDSYITRTWIVNPSSWTNLYISTVSVNMSTGTFFVPPSTVFSPDGPAVPFWGQLYACSSATVSGLNITAQNASIMRAK